MAKIIPKKASAPMEYNKAIRVDEIPIDHSEALITSAGVAQAFKDYEKWLRSISLLDLSTLNLGYFRIVVNNKSINYGVDFNTTGEPTRIYSMDNDDFDMKIDWW